MAHIDPVGPGDFSLSLDTLAYIVPKARAYDAQVPPVDPDDGSNATDDGEALEDGPNNPTGRELQAAIASLDVDAQATLVALTWLGREEYEADEWGEALAEARNRAEAPTWAYLMGMPLLGDYLEEGAAMLGLDLAPEEAPGMHHPAIEKPPPH